MPKPKKHNKTKRDKKHKTNKKKSNTLTHRKCSLGDEYWGNIDFRNWMNSGKDKNKVKTVRSMYLSNQPYNDVYANIRHFVRLNHLTMHNIIIPNVEEFVEMLPDKVNRLNLSMCGIQKVSSSIQLRDTIKIDINDIPIKKYTRRLKPHGGGGNQSGGADDDSSDYTPPPPPRFNYSPLSLSDLDPPHDADAVNYGYDSDELNMHPPGVTNQREGDSDDDSDDDSEYMINPPLDIDPRGGEDNDAHINRLANPQPMNVGDEPIVSADAAAAEIEIINNRYPLSTEKSDISVSQDPIPNIPQQSYDPITMENISLIATLTDNILIYIVSTCDNPSICNNPSPSRWANTSRSALRDFINEIPNSNIVYECRQPDGDMWDTVNNVVFNRPLFRISMIDGETERSFVPLSQINTLIEQSSQMYSLVPTDEILPSTVSRSMFMQQDNDLSGASHCQRGQDGRVYNLVAYEYQ